MSKKSWYVSLFVLILSISLVSIASAHGTGNQQPSQSTKPAITKQPALAQNTSQQSQAKPTDLYNQMLQLCQQVGYPMMQNCPMLNGSQMTREQMIKYCLNMYNQVVKQQPNSQISQQNWQVMQQMCQQWYSKYYPQGQNSSWNTAATKNSNYKNVSNNWNNNMNMNQNWSNNNWNRSGNSNWGNCGW